MKMNNLRYYEFPMKKIELETMLSHLLGLLEKTLRNSRTWSIGKDLCPLRKMLAHNHPQTNSC